MPKRKKKSRADAPENSGARSKKLYSANLASSNQLGMIFLQPIEHVFAQALCEFDQFFGVSFARNAG